MKYIPNRNKICYMCGKEILYNQEYIATDHLSAKGEVECKARHEWCSHALSGINYGTYAMSSSPGSIIPVPAASAIQPYTPTYSYPHPQQQPNPYKLIKKVAPLTPYGTSKKPSLRRRVVKAILGGKHDAYGQTAQEENK